MSAVWHCPACLALTVGDDACRACGRSHEAPWDAPAPTPRLLLGVREDRPARGRRPRDRGASLLAPGVLLLAAIGLSFGFEPIASEVAFAHTPEASLARRTHLRQAELQHAARDLRTLTVELRPALATSGGRPPSGWRDRLDDLGRRHDLAGGASGSPFADQEVALRACALELASLHHRFVAGTLAGDALSRLDATERDLALVMEDLTHAP